MENEINTEIKPSVMYKEFKSLSYRVIMRFGRAFAAGFVAGALEVIRANGGNVSTLLDLKNLGIMVLVGGATGALMGLDKWIRG